MAAPIHPMSDEAREAYRRLAMMPRVAEAVLADLEAQIPGDFCPDNQYVTAHNLGALRIVQILAVRLAECQSVERDLPEQTT